MKLLKYSLSLGLVLALWFNPDADAQLVSPAYSTALLVGATNSVSANSTNTPAAAVIDCSRAQVITLFARGVLGAAGTETIRLEFNRGFGSLTNAAAFNFETTPGVVWEFPATGTTTNVVSTNIYTLGYSTLRLTAVGNGNTSTWSAVQIRSGYSTLKK